MTRQPIIVFATSAEQPLLTQSDQLAARALEQRGASVVAAPWNGERGVFGEADKIIVRSTWDYQKHAAAFEDWLNGFANDARLLNPASLMAWNMSKRYLLELAGKGAPVAPLVCAAATPDAIIAAMDALGLEEAVVKPEIGATASGLSRVHRNNPASIRAAAAALGMNGLVQSLIPEIASAGETSVMFFADDYSHAVTKRPKEGDIRCQEEHGGSVALAKPPAWVIDEAARLLALAPGHPIYGRVDVVYSGEKMWLMELELIEPELFFPYCPVAADRFASAIWNTLEEVN